MRSIAAMAACGLLVACLAGCKSAAPAARHPLTASPDEPKWVSMGARAFPADAGQALYGVGIAQASRFPDDPFLLRKAATDNARDLLGRQLRPLVTAVFKDYSAAAFAPTVNPADVQSMTENVLRSVSDATLANVKSVTSWKDSQTGDMYVLVRLSLDDVAQQLRTQIATAEKGHLALDPAAAHKELDRIIEKERQQAK